MSRQSSIDSLNELLGIHSSSLARYLAQVRPWTVVPSDTKWVDVVCDVADGHQATIDRLAKLIMANDGAVKYAGYPMEFTGIHDLSLDFLLDELILNEKQMLAAMESCLQSLHSDPVAKSAAEEAIGEAKGHLESLQELKSRSVTTSTGT